MFYKVKNCRKGGEREIWQSIGIITARERINLYMGNEILMKKRKITEMEITDNRT